MGLETKKPPTEVGPPPGSAGGSLWVALASSSPGSTAGAVVGPQGLIQPAEMSGEKVVSVGKAARPACGVGSLRKKTNHHKTTTPKHVFTCKPSPGDPGAGLGGDKLGCSATVQAGISAVGRGQLLE